MDFQKSEFLWDFISNVLVNHEFTARVILLQRQLQVGNFKQLYVANV